VRCAKTSAVAACRVPEVVFIGLEWRECLLCPGMPDTLESAPVVRTSAPVRGFGPPVPVPPVPAQPSASFSVRRLAPVPATQRNRDPGRTPHACLRGANMRARAPGGVILATPKKIPPLPGRDGQPVEACGTTLSQVRKRAQHPRSAPPMRDPRCAALREVVDAARVQRLTRMRSPHTALEHGT
jgi:hypothetical protein